MNPPMNVINTIQKIFAQFFWSSCIGGKERHWVRWQSVCFPKEEGGLGFRMLKDVYMALFCKLWWNFRNIKSIWSAYMHKKYNKKEHPNMIIWRKGLEVHKCGRRCCRLEI